MQYWFYLAGAIALEAAGTTSMKLSGGFTNLAPSILIFLFYAASFVALTFALKGIDVSLAYAIWSGIGTVVIATIGILYFQEPATALKIVSIGIIVVGVAGLKLSGVNH
jgi:small multidrug resistance pump